MREIVGHVESAGDSHERIARTAAVGDDPAAVDTSGTKVLASITIDHTSDVPGKARRGRPRRAVANELTSSGTTAEASQDHRLPVPAVGGNAPVDNSGTTSRSAETTLSTQLVSQRQSEQSSADISQIIKDLVVAGDNWSACVVAQSRHTRPIELQIARCLGYTGRKKRPDDDDFDEDEKTVIARGEEARNKRLFKQAQEIRVAVEKDKPFVRPPEESLKGSLDTWLRMVPLEAMVRAEYDELRKQTEKDMIRLARQLPVADWVREHAKGIGDLGLAKLIAVGPMIGSYPTHAKYWKRMCVAVIDDKRQQRIIGNPALALRHGYSPSRRAMVWSVCWAGPLLGHQWHGGTEDEPGYAVGPYGEVYRRRKEYTKQKIAETSHLTPKDKSKWHGKRCEADARRVMAKAFLRDLWRVWRGMEAIHPRRWLQQQQQAA